MSKTEVPFSGKPGKHPIAIGTSFNIREAKWDVALYVGNFDSKHEAAEYADRIAEFLRENADAELLARQ